MIHRQGKPGSGDNRNVSTFESGERKGKAGKGNKSKEKLEARFYEQDEWNKEFTAEERCKVLDELKKAKKMKKNKDKGSSKRKASAVEKDKDEPASNNEGDGEAESNEEQAENEFGRGAHKKKKVTISSTATQAALPKQAQRHVMVTTTRRFVMDNAQLASQGNEGRVELDTHVDTCIAGSKLWSLTSLGSMLLCLPSAKERLMQFRTFRLQRLQLLMTVLRRERHIF